MEASNYQKRKRSLLTQLLRVPVCNVYHGRFTSYGPSRYFRVRILLQGHQVLEIPTVKAIHRIVGMLNFGLSSPKYRKKNKVFIW
jgi:hypothetical protein